MLVLFLCLPFLGLWFEGMQLNQVRPLLPAASLDVGPWRWVVQGMQAIYRKPAAPSALPALPQRREREQGAADADGERQAQGRAQAHGGPGRRG
ncbi:hypothetical protein, partial [Geminicoccus harenae]|uniref:hypothetical protein n=1 Tax=Geminicoccus harenae TaxID=2498453 RepID=UPI00168BE430